MAKKKPSTDKLPKLTIKQELFCMEYIIDYNATRASIAAGYSEKTARAIGAENLTKPLITAFIEKAKAEAIEKSKITLEMVVSRISQTAFGDIRKLYNDSGVLMEPHELSDEAAAMVTSFTTKREGSDREGYTWVDEYKKSDPLKALDMLMKHLGGYVEKKEITHSGHITMLPEKDQNN